MLYAILYLNHTRSAALHNLMHLTAYRCWILPYIAVCFSHFLRNAVLYTELLWTCLTGEASHYICLRRKFRMNLWPRFSLCHKLSTNFSQEKPFSTYILISAAWLFFLLLDVNFINQDYIDCPDLQHFQMVYSAVGNTKRYQHVGTTSVRGMCKYWEKKSLCTCIRNWT